MRRLHFFIFAAAFILLAPLSSLAADTTGNWEINMEGPMGPDVWKLDLKADGTATGEHSIFGNVKGKNNCVGDKFDVLFKFESPMGEITSHFIGTVSGNTAKGTINIMEMPVEWVGEKK